MDKDALERFPVFENSMVRDSEWDCKGLIRHIFRSGLLLLPPSKRLRYYLQKFKYVDRNKVS